LLAKPSANLRHENAILLALVTLGDLTQIKMLVFASQHQTKQVKQVFVVQN
jgi:hypothetical protein